MTVAMSIAERGMVVEKPEKKKKMKDVEKMEKTERKRLRKEAEARGALYLMHWRSTTPSNGANKGPAAAAGQGIMGETKQYLAAMQDDLKRVEKVSKVTLHIWCLYFEFSCPFGLRARVSCALTAPRLTVILGLGFSIIMLCIFLQASLLACIAIPFLVHRSF